MIQVILCALVFTFAPFFAYFRSRCDQRLIEEIYDPEPLTLSIIRKDPLGTNIGVRGGGGGGAGGTAAPQFDQKR